MNRLKGKIVAIEEFDGLQLIKAEVGAIQIQTVVISDQKDASFLIVNNEVELNFKETEVVLAKDDHSRISIENKFESEVVSIKSKKLLCQVSLKFENYQLSVIISNQSKEVLDIKENDKVWTYIKSNDILISPC